MDLNLPWWIWICWGEFEFAEVNLNLPQWICRGEFLFAVASLNLLWWILICLGEFEFTLVNLKLPQWIWTCCRDHEFEIAAVNLNLQLWIWICHGEFEIYSDPQVSRQKFLIHSKTLNSFHNTLLFGAKFLFIWATHFNHCKTFFLRQNFFLEAKLSHQGKASFLVANFKKQGKSSFLLAKHFTIAKLFIQSVYNLLGEWGAPLGEDDAGEESDSFIDPIFSNLGRIFQPFCKLKVPF